MTEANTAMQFDKKREIDVIWVQGNYRLVRWATANILQTLKNRKVK